MEKKFDKKYFIFLIHQVGDVTSSAEFDKMLFLIYQARGCNHRQVVQQLILDI